MKYWEKAELVLDSHVGKSMKLSSIFSLLPLYKDGNPVKLRTIPKKLKHRLERLDRVRGQLRKIDGDMIYLVLPRVSPIDVVEKPLDKLDRSYLEEACENIVEMYKKEKEWQRKRKKKKTESPSSE